MFGYEQNFSKESDYDMAYLFTINKSTKTNQELLKPKFKDFIGRGFTTIAYNNLENNQLVNLYTIEPCKVEYARRKDFTVDYYGHIAFVNKVKRAPEKVELDIYLVTMPKLLKLSKKEQNVLNKELKQINPLVSKYSLSDFWFKLQESDICFPDKELICDVAIDCGGEIYPDLSARQFMKDSEGKYHCVDNGISKKILSYNLSYFNSK